MKTDDFSRSVAVVAVNFQGEVRTQGTLPDALTAYLRTEIFPLSAPPSLRSAKDYGGVKIFLYQDRFVCVGYFYDAGKTDEFARAVASAVVLVFDRALYQNGFRNFFALRDFLIDASQNGGQNEDYLPVLRSLYDEASVTNSQEQFTVFLNRMGISISLLASGVGLMAAQRRLLVCAPTPAKGQAFLGALFAVAPAAFLEASWCTYANTLSGRYEEVVTFSCQLAGSRETSWMDKVKTRFAGEKEESPAVDVGSGAVQGPVRRTVNRRIAERVTTEIQANRMGLSLPFPQRFLLYTHLLQTCRQNAPVTLSGLPTELAMTADITRRVEAFLAEVAASKD